MSANVRGSTNDAVVRMLMDQYDLTDILEPLVEENPIDDRHLRPGARAELKPQVLAQIAERPTRATQGNIAAVEMYETMTRE